MTFETYQSVNRSFKKICVYRIGNEAGFFSEINNMLVAMIFCLEHRLQFRLYSANSNFGEDIWKDYFLPFTTHTTAASHFLFNERPYINKRPYPLSVPDLFSIKKELAKQFLTQDIWPYIRDKNVYNADYSPNSPYVEGTLISAAAMLIRCVWRYNKSTKNKINSLKKSLGIPQSYCALFIRRGDKKNEAAYEDIEKYFFKLENLGCYNDLPIFIASDDYQVIIEAKKIYPKRQIYSFEFQEDTGYYMNNFVSDYTSDQQKQKIRQLLAQVELLINAKAFIGTYTTNVSVFVGMARGGKNSYDINNLDWLLW